jgi:hypothetical protein
MEKWTNNDLQNNTQKTEDCVPRTLLKQDKPMFSGRVSSYCFISDAPIVILCINVSETAGAINN